VPYKTARIAHELMTYTDTIDHLTSHDTVKSEPQPHKELQAVVHLSSECSSPAISDDEQNVIPNNSSVTKKTHCYANKPVSWDDLPCFLQSIIPSDEEYSYVIEECNELPAEGFSGAPSNRFIATMRINLNNGEEAKDWLDKMCNHSKCTYRITRTYKPSLKWILWRTDMHCQHQRKPISTKQLAAKALNKKKTNPLMEELREKKTTCPSCFVLKVQNPTKRDLYSRYTRFLLFSQRIS